MCLNGWGGKLHDRLLPYLQAVDPDVLCLQEVVHTPTTKKPWLTYRDGDHVLPQRANFYRDIANNLPGHTGVFCAAARGVLWDDQTEIPSYWGLATWVRQTYPVIAQKQTFVHKTFSPHTYGDHPRSRPAHAVRVFDYEKDRPITIAHMHGLRDLRGKIDTAERAQQAKVFLDLARDVSTDDDPVVLCGDFNVGPQSETLEILGNAGFTELVTSRTHQGTRNSLYPKPEKYADYLLVNDAVEVMEFDVVFEPEVSDHCPLILSC
ncbi:MAG: endonuclease/exonuclease/phosphatase family protein [Synoicihabitans sp.]